MATPRFARLARATELSADTRMLELEMTEPLGFIGGQYVIVDSGLVLPSGKACKRAYSILTPDTSQDRFTLASKRIPGGLGSGYVHEAPLGAELKFSGPWGKMFPAVDASGKTLVLATDTGITAALGLVRGARFAPLLPQTAFYWLRTSGEYFLPDALVRSLSPLPPTIVDLAPINHPERVPFVRALVRELLPTLPTLNQAFIAGDGAVNYALLADLVAAGVPASRDSVESFFNMPPKTAA